MNDIPILDGEEFSLQEAIDKERQYKVYFYFYNYIENKTFDSLKEAVEFSMSLPTGNVYEIKRVEDGR
jgi:hypothetical protein